MPDQPFDPPIDTTGTGGGGATVGQPCDPDSVYFERDILPILISNCAKSGCHDEASAEEGVVLTNFEKVFQTGEIKPFDPEDSELFEKISEDDPDKIMPPPSETPLTQDQIKLIQKWINQGAQDLSCEEAGKCDTLQMSFLSDVKPILQTKCVGCHSGSDPSGGISLNTYIGVLGVVNNGALIGAINRQGGFPAMPKGGSKMPDCEINTIQAWINQGSLDN